MSFLASLGSKFSAANPSSSPAPTGNGQNGNGGQMNFQRPAQPNANGGEGGGNNQFDGNGNPIGAPGQSATNSNTPADPLAIFDKLFDNAANPEVAPGFSIPPDKMKDLRAQQDFMKGIDPEVMQRATSGDMQAMMQIMHDVARNAYATSLDHGSRLTESFVGARESFGKKSLGNSIRAELTNNALDGIEGVNHPVIKKHLKQVAQQMQSVYPDASPADIAKMAKDFVTQMATPFQQQQSPQQGAQKQPVNTEWDTWFEN